MVAPAMIDSTTAWSGMQPRSPAITLDSFCGLTAQDHQVGVGDGRAVIGVGMDPVASPRALSTRENRGPDARICSGR